MLDMGSYLKASREAVGLTQMQVAKQLGYTTAQFVSNWERNLSYPPIKAIPKLGKLYKKNSRMIFEHVLKAALEITRASMIREYREYKRSA